MRQHGVQPLLHYLDNFLTVGPPNSNICQQNLDTIKQVCDILGVPLALEKVEGPATSLSFLGITFDTVTMEAKLPPEKPALSWCCTHQLLNTLFEIYLV